jgi:hypothetical protein
VGVLQSCQDRVEVTAGLGRRQTAQSVIAAEFDDDHRRVRQQDLAQTGGGVLGGGPARAPVADSVVVALGVKVSLQRVGKRLAGLEPVTGGDAVAVADEQGPVGGEQGQRRDQQPKRNEDRAANVHRNSVAKSRELEAGGGKSDRGT